jgi:hypothetical protein
MLCNLSNNFISEDSSRVGPGEAPLEAPGSQTVGALTMLPPSQSQQASRLHSRSEITLLNRDEVRELTPIAAAAAHQDRGLAVRRATSQLRSTNTNREGRDVRDYQFRPSQQQRGLNLFALEPGGPLEQAMHLAHRIAAGIPRSDPPRPGQQGIWKPSCANAWTRLVETVWTGGIFASRC